jgi:hypothetical protein
VVLLVWIRVEGGEEEEWSLVRRCLVWFGGFRNGDGRVAAAGRGVEGDLRIARAVSLANGGPVADLAAAPAVQPAAGL